MYYRLIEMEAAGERVVDDICSQLIDQLNSSRGSGGSGSAASGKSGAGKKSAAAADVPLVLMPRAPFQILVRSIFTQRFSALAARSGAEANATSAIGKYILSRFDHFSQRIWSRYSAHVFSVIALRTPTANTKPVCID